MDELPAKRRPSISQLSKTPSWVMLGFLFGAAFVWSLPKREPAQRPVVVASPERQVIVKTPRPLTLIEAVFEQWHELATWDQNVTQVAMWSSEDGDFSDLYEVRRVDGGFYYRSIPKLTNRPIRHGKPVPPECPLRFTETEAQYQEWREQGRYERPAEKPLLRPMTGSDPTSDLTPQHMIERQRREAEESERAMPQTTPIDPAAAKETPAGS